MSSTKLEDVFIQSFFIENEISRSWTMDLFMSSLLGTRYRTKLGVRQRPSCAPHLGQILCLTQRLCLPGLLCTGERRCNSDANKAHLSHSSAVNLDCSWASFRCSRSFLHLRAMQEARMVRLSVVGLAMSEEHPLHGGGTSFVRCYQQLQKTGVLCYQQLQKMCVLCWYSELKSL